MASEKSVVDLTKDDDSGASKPKKMKQMRLPFATIDKNASIAKMEDAVKKEKEEIVSKKRKHSAESTEDEAEESSKKTDEIKSPNTVKVKIGSAKKKAKTDTKSDDKVEHLKEKKEADLRENKASEVKKKTEAKKKEVEDIKTDESAKEEIKENIESKNEKAGAKKSPEKVVEVSAPQNSPMIKDAMLKTPELKPKKEVSSSEKVRNLTPKQLARKAEFDNKREEKEKAKEEARIAREKEKEKREAEKKEKEAQKERERKEREAQKEKERKEKEALKEKERLEKEAQKEKERLEREKLKQEKEEERLKKKKEKEDQKEQQRVQKEEEETKKREEKEEREKQEKAKAKKLKQNFAKFFVKQEVTPSKAQNETTEAVSNGLNQFRIKSHMKLAPLVRIYEAIDKSKVDPLINAGLSQNDLYLALLKKGQVKTGSFGKTWPFSARKNDDDDIEIINEDEEDEIGDEIMENDKDESVIKQSIGKVYKKAKFLAFEENQRPPYFGTWSKKSVKISARKPFAMDAEFFDYDYDSDEDWEEEEQGESLSDEEKDKEEDEKDEKEDQDDNDDGFFVGHGVLDKDELKGVEEGDEDAFDEELEIKKQKLKAAQFEEEYKKKATKLKPRVFGCFWNDPNNEDKDNDLRIAYDQLIKILNPFKAVMFNPEKGFIIPTSISNPPEKSKESPDSKKEAKSQIAKEKMLKVFPDNAMPELIKLVHANVNNKVFLTKEFHEFWSKKDAGIIPKTKIVAKIQEIADYSRIEGMARKSWVVKEEILKHYGIEQPEIPNKWEYILDLPSNKSGGTPKTGTPTTHNTPAKVAYGESGNSGETPKSEKSGKTENLAKTASPALLITKFTKVLSEEERKKAMEKSAAKSVVSAANSAPKPGIFGSNPVASSSPKVNVLTPKRKIQPTLVDLTGSNDQDQSGSGKPLNAGKDESIKPENSAKPNVNLKDSKSPAANPITPKRRIQLTQIDKKKTSSPANSTTENPQPSTSGSNDANPNASKSRQPTLMDFAKKS